MKALELIRDLLEQSSEEKSFVAGIAAVAEDVSVDKKTQARATFAYLLGTSEELPENPPKNLHRYVDDLCALLREPGSWTERDHRLFGVIHHRAIWSPSDFLSWAAKQIGAHPDNNVYGALCEDLKHLGLSESSIRTFSFSWQLSETWVTDGGELTSAGRWLAEASKNLTSLLTEIEECANGGNRVKYNLAKVLVRVRPEQIPEYLNKASFKDDGWIGEVALVLLEADPSGLQELALSLEPHIKGAMKKYRFGRSLHKRLDASFHPHVLELMQEALIGFKELGGVFVENGTTKHGYEYRLELTDFVMREFPEQSHAIVKHYVEKSAAARIRFFESVAEHLGQSGVYILVEGLMYKWGQGSAMYGHNMTYAKYIRVVLALLARFDATMHHDLIWQTFSETENQKLREIVAGYFARLPNPIAFATEKLNASESAVRVTAAAILAKTKSEAAHAVLESVAQTEKSKDVRAFINKALVSPKFTEPKEAYNFDDYANKVLIEAIEELRSRKQEISQPVMEVKFHISSIQVYAAVLILEGGREICIEICGPETHIPPHLDECWRPEEDPSDYPDDRVLTDFLRRHGADLDDDHAPNWGDNYELPRCLYLRELALTAESLREQIRGLGIQLSDDCRSGTGDHDELLSAEGFDWFIKESMWYFTDDVMLKEFAAICFRDPKKRAWFESQAHE